MEILDLITLYNTYQEGVRKSKKIALKIAKRRISIADVFEICDTASPSICAASNALCTG